MQSSVDLNALFYTFENRKRRPTVGSSKIVPLRAAKSDCPTYFIRNGTIHVEARALLEHELVKAGRLGQGVGGHQLGASARSHLEAQRVTESRARSVSFA